MQATSVLVVALLLLASAGRGAAIEIAIDRAAIGRALVLARASEAERAAFHGRYLRMLDDPLVDRFELITEFRRVVLFAEERARFGDLPPGVNQAEEALRPWRNRLSIVAHLRFHPQNVYVSVPSYEVALGNEKGGPAAQDALDTRRVPLYGVPGSGPQATSIPAPPAAPGPTSTILGASVEAIFEAEAASRVRLRPVRVLLDGKELARLVIDLGQFE